jgi:glycosyltransferase involved in cell wall biosynthesis
MAEAQACGTPVIAFRRGGAADIVEDGVTGFLMEHQDADEVRRAVARSESEVLDRATIRASAERFSADRFRRKIRQAVEEMVASERV